MVPVTVLSSLTFHLNWGTKIMGEDHPRKTPRHCSPTSSNFLCRSPPRYVGERALMVSFRG